MAGAEPIAPVMGAPVVTRGQLLPVVEQALGRAESSDTRPVVLVHADPTDPPELGTVHGRTVEVHGSRSPLEIRALLRAVRETPLVVLTTCEAGALGDDVLARVVGRHVERVNRWAIVAQLFGAERPSPDLARRPHLADALIEAAPISGYPRVMSRVLDLDTAVAALVRTAIGVPDDVDDLAAFLWWVDHPEATGRVAAAQGELFPDVEVALRLRFGPGIDAVLAALAAGRAGELVPFGLVAGLVFAERAIDRGVTHADTAAAVRLDERLGAPHLAAHAYRAWGTAAEEVVMGDDDRARIAGWLDRAGTVLTELGAAHLAEHSDLLPEGFQRRIRVAAEALARWHAEPDSEASADATSRAIDRVARHVESRRAGERVERLRMAERLIRRRDLRLTGLDDLGMAATAYEADGAWLDAARTVVSRGDTDPVLAALYAQLTVTADEARTADGRAFARLASQAATGVPTPHLGVEEILDRVVVPLAGVRPVLLVVLDGLGWPTFTEIVGALEGSGWAPWRLGGEQAPSQVAVAALPTVTEVSRTSLFAGRLRTGDDGSERRAFASHSGLLTVTGSGPAPELFHKRMLRAGGLDTLPQGVLDAVADGRRRVIGLVLNNIDERLKDVAQPGDGWELRDLDPLRLVLDEARLAGRAVVLAADHGHVLDRDAEVRPGSGGGERWRHVGEGPGDGEVLVHGPRVVVDDHRVVLPWQEQLRYGPRRNGYHGGFTPRELFVPLVVLVGEDLPEDKGWQPSGFRRPSWWHATQLRRIEPARRVVPVTTSAATPTLFDQSVDEGANAQGLTSPDWLDALQAAPAYAERRANPRVRLQDDEIRRLLAVLDAAAPMAVTTGRLAEEAALPVARIDRYVAQLQELLNVDGYGVVTTAVGEVRFDRALFERQFGL